MQKKIKEIQGPEVNGSSDSSQDPNQNKAVGGTVRVKQGDAEYDSGNVPKEYKSVVGSIVNKYAGSQTKPSDEISPISKSKYQPIVDSIASVYQKKKEETPLDSLSGEYLQPPGDTSQQPADTFQWSSGTTDDIILLPPGEDDTYIQKVREAKERYNKALKKLESFDNPFLITHKELDALSNGDDEDYRALSYAANTLKKDEVSKIILRDWDRVKGYIEAAKVDVPKELFDKKGIDYDAYKERTGINNYINETHKDAPAELKRMLKIRLYNEIEDMKLIDKALQEVEASGNVQEAYSRLYDKKKSLENAIDLNIKALNDDYNKIKMSLTRQYLSAVESEANKIKSTPEFLQYVKKIENDVNSGAISHDMANAMVNEYIQNVLKDNKRISEIQSQIDEEYKKYADKYNELTKQSIEFFNNQIASVLEEATNIKRKELDKAIKKLQNEELQARMKEWQDKGFLGKMATGFKSGKAPFYETAALVADWLDMPNVSDGMYVAANATRRQSWLPDVGTFSWKHIIDQDWWASRMMPSMLSTITLAGVGFGTAAATAAASAAAVPLSASILIGAAAGGTSSRLIESFMEAAGRRQQILDEGGSMEYANERAADIARQNMLLVFNDVMQIAAILTPIKLPASRLLKLAYETTSEGSEEVYQGMIQARDVQNDLMYKGELPEEKFIRDNPILGSYDFLVKYPEGVESFVLGSIMGAAFYTITSGIDMAADVRSVLNNNRINSAILDLLSQSPDMSDKLSKAGLIPGESVLDIRVSQIKKTLDNLYNKGYIKEDKYRQFNSRLNKIADALHGLPDDLSRDEKLAIIDRLIEIEELSNKANTVRDESLKGAINEQIKAKQKEVESIMTKDGTVPIYTINGVSVSKDLLLKIISNDGFQSEIVNGIRHKIRVYNDEATASHVRSVIEEVLNRSRRPQEEAGGERQEDEAAAAAIGPGPQIIPPDETAPHIDESTEEQVEKGTALPAEKAVTTPDEGAGSQQAEKDAVTLDDDLETLEYIYNNQQFYDELIAIMGITESTERADALLDLRRRARQAINAEKIQSQSVRNEEKGETIVADEQAPTQQTSSEVQDSAPAESVGKPMAEGSEAVRGSGEVVPQQSGETVMQDSGKEASIAPEDMPATPKGNEKQLTYDKEDETRISGGVQIGEATEQKQSDIQAGGEKAPSGGILQAQEKIAGEEKPKKVGEVNKAFKESKIVYGSDTTIEMPDGQTRNAQYALVELDDIIASHKEDNFNDSPGYPTYRGLNVNPRNYKDDSVARMAVINNAKNLKPSIIISDAATPDSGVPIISEDGIVVSGNGRTMSLKMAEKYYPDKYENYKNTLYKKAQIFGINQEDVKSFKKPVLVKIDRNILEYTQYDLDKYNKQMQKGESLEDDVLKKSAILALKPHVKESLFNIVGKHDTLGQLYESNESISSIKDLFLSNGIILPHEVNIYFTGNNVLSDSGKELIDGLLIAAMLSPEATRAAFKSKSFMSNIANAAPALAKNFMLDRRYNIWNYVNEAVIMQSDFVSRGLNDKDIWALMTNLNIFYSQVDPDIFIINRLIAAGPRIFKGVVMAINESATTSEGSLFGDISMTLSEVLDKLIESRLNKHQVKILRMLRKEYNAYLESGKDIIALANRAFEEFGLTQHGSGWQTSNGEIKVTFNNDGTINVTWKENGETKTSSGNKLYTAIEKVRLIKESYDKDKSSGKSGKRESRKEQIRKELDDLWDEFRKLNDKLTSGIDPEKLALAIKIMAKYAELGIYKFSDIIEDASIRFGEKIKDIYDAIKAGYLAYYSQATDDVASKMDEPSYVRKLRLTDIVKPVSKYKTVRGEVTGHIESIPGAEHIDVIVTKSISGKYEVYEAATGVYIGSGNTKEQALQKAAPKAAKMSYADIHKNVKAGSISILNDSPKYSEYVKSLNEQVEDIKNKPSAIELRRNSILEKEKQRHADAIAAIEKYGTNEDKKREITIHNGNLTAINNIFSNLVSLNSSQQAVFDHYYDRYERGGSYEVVKDEITPDRYGELASEIGRMAYEAWNAFESLNALRQSKLPASTEDKKQQKDVSGTDIHLEHDSQRPETEDRLGEEDVPTGQRDIDKGIGQIRGRTGQGGLSGEDSDLIRGDVPDISGESGDTEIHQEVRAGRSDVGVPDTGVSQRGSSDYAEGEAAQQRGYRESDESVPAEGTGNVVSYEERLEKQRQAEVIPYNGSNEKDVLPFLLPHQLSNVRLALKRFKDRNGFGVFDQTGTGKTITALGIAKIFLKQREGNILIVVVSQKKIEDWVNEGKRLLINITPLKNTKDNGGDNNVVITTYANFASNNSLLKKDWALVIYDESQNINSNLSGSITKAQQRHFEITGYIPYVIRNVLDRYSFNNRIEELKRNGDLSGIEALKREVENEIQKNIGKTKAVFLSATPFAYHNSLSYVDGYLVDVSGSLSFSIDKYVERGVLPSMTEGIKHFLVEKFKYSLYNGDLVPPNESIDIDKLERDFHEELRNEGAIVASRINIEYDYSRHFIAIDGGKIGMQMDEYMRKVMNDKRFKRLWEVLRTRLWTYHYTNRILESIKAREVIPIIKEYVKAGKKVVVFHNYNEGAPSNPFDFQKELRALKNSVENDKRLTTWTRASIFSSIDLAMRDAILFDKEYPDAKNLKLYDLTNVIDILTKEFGDSAVLFNGNIPDKQRSKNVKEFNEGDKVNVIIVNLSAGESGLNLHDRDGKYQRVIINLGLPIRPTHAIQSEGRISMRADVKSDAIILYPAIYTNFERFAFSKINVRSRTVENLAMGNKARNLEIAFKHAYLNPISDIKQATGKGGKNLDKELATKSNFDIALQNYYDVVKENPDGFDGSNYVTPEPIALKMVEWADPEPGSYGMEPSAGTGSIAKWFPRNTYNLFIEKSYENASKLSIVSKGRINIDKFETKTDHSKYDFIIMAPPLGATGETAILHFKKALTNLKERGRLIAVMPNNMDDKIEKALKEYNDKVYYREKLAIIGRVRLPSFIFNVKGVLKPSQIIIVSDAGNKNIDNLLELDLSNAKDANEVFERIKNVKMPYRRGNIMMRGSLSPEEKGLMEAKGIVYYGGIYEHVNTKEKFYSVIADEKLNKSVLYALARIAFNLNGSHIYSWGDRAYKFLFTSKQDAEKFMAGAAILENNINKGDTDYGPRIFRDERTRFILDNNDSGFAWRQIVFGGDKPINIPIADQIKWVAPVKAKGDETAVIVYDQPYPDNVVESAVYAIMHVLDGEMFVPVKILADGSVKKITMSEYYYAANKAAAARDMPDILVQAMRNKASMQGAVKNQVKEYIHLFKDRFYDDLQFAILYKQAVETAINKFNLISKDDIITEDSIGVVRDIAWGIYNRMPVIKNNKIPEYRPHIPIAYGNESVFAGALREIYEYELKSKHDKELSITSFVTNKEYRIPSVGIVSVGSNMAKRGFVNVLGQSVETYDDIMDLFESIRNPLMEVSVLVFMKGNTILHVTVNTSGMPQYVDVGMDANEIVAIAKRIGADTVKFIHNHPSGNPTPSSGDRQSIIRYARELHKHGVKADLLVYDDEEYALIKHDDAISYNASHALIKGKKRENFYRSGVTEFNADVAKSILNSMKGEDADTAYIVYVNEDLMIVGWELSDAKSIESGKMYEHIHSKMRWLGAGRFILLFNKPIVADSISDMHIPEGVHVIMSSHGDMVEVFSRNRSVDEAVTRMWDNEREYKTFEEFWRIASDDRELIRSNLIKAINANIDDISRKLNIAKGLLIKTESQAKQEAKNITQNALHSYMAKLFDLPNKVLLQNVLSKYVNDIEEWIASSLIRAQVSHNAVFRELETVLSTMSRGITDTKIWDNIRSQMKGDIATSRDAANRIAKALYSIVNANPDSLYAAAVWLDPELHLHNYGMITATGKPNTSYVLFMQAIEKKNKLREQIYDAQRNGMPIHNLAIEWEKVNKEIDQLNISGFGRDLTKEERVLVELLTIINTITHNSNYLLYIDSGGKYGIPRDVWEKFRDPITGKAEYIARLYDSHIIKGDEKFFMKAFKMVLGMYHKRDEAELWHAIHSIKDPVFLTVLRYTQTQKNFAINDYANTIIHYFGYNNRYNNPVLVMTDKQMNEYIKMHNLSESPMSVEEYMAGYVRLDSSYGNLSEKWVAKRIAEDLNGFFYVSELFTAINKAFTAYDMLLPRRFYRTLLTALNLPVIVGNKAMNYVFAFWGGINPVSFMLYEAEAYRQIRDGKDAYIDLIRAGLIGRTTYELFRMYDQLATHGLNVFMRSADKARKFYQFIDDQSKVQAYLVLTKDLGYSKEEAIARIREIFQTGDYGGRLWDLAAKTPLFGNMFARFLYEALKIKKNAWLKRPIYAILFYTLVRWLFSRSTDEEGEEMDDLFDLFVTERGVPQTAGYLYSGVPYIDLKDFSLKYGELPLSVVIHGIRIDYARLAETMYLYNQGDDFVNRVAWLNKVQPFSVIGYRDDRGGLSVETSFPDPFLGPLFNVLRNKDYAGRPVDNPRRLHNITDKQRLYNIIEYITMSYLGPYGVLGIDLYHSLNEEPDRYGRRKLPQDLLLNQIVKVQRFGSEEVRDAITRRFLKHEYEYNMLLRDLSIKRTAAFREIIKQGATEKEINDIIETYKESVQGVHKKYMEWAERVNHDIEIINKISSNIKYTDLQELYYGYVPTKLSRDDMVTMGKREMEKKKKGIINAMDEDIEAAMQKDVARDEVLRYLAKHFIRSRNTDIEKAAAVIDYLNMLPKEERTKELYMLRRKEGKSKEPIVNRDVYYLVQKELKTTK